MQNLTPYFDFPSPHCLFTIILLGGGATKKILVRLHQYQLTLTIS